MYSTVRTCLHFTAISYACTHIGTYNSPCRFLLFFWLGDLEFLLFLPGVDGGVFLLVLFVGDDGTLVDLFFSATLFSVSWCFLFDPMLVILLHVNIVSIRVYF